MNDGSGVCVKIAPIPSRLGYPPHEGKSAPRYHLGLFNFEAIACLGVPPGNSTPRAAEMSEMNYPHHPPNEHQLRKILDDVSDLVQSIDLNGNIQLVNQT